MATGNVTLSNFLTPTSYATLIVPILALVISLMMGSKLVLDYIHVICGGTWTGIDLFMGLVMSRVMRGLDPEGALRLSKGSCL